MTVLSPLQVGRSVGQRRVAAHLSFRRAGGRTILAAQKTPHPFHITRPFHLTGDPEGMATLYLQSSSGGLYGDDDLSLAVTSEPGAAAQVTTQASTIVHAARGGRTRQAVQLSIGEDSHLEFLPDPAILFAGADLAASVEARLAPGASLLLSDSALTHDPTGGGASFLHYANTITVSGPDGRALMIERSAVSGADWARRTGKLPVHGLLVAAGAIVPDAIAQALTDTLPSDGATVYGAASAFPERGLVTFRLLARDGASFSRALDAAWRAARRAMTGIAPEHRRK